MKHKWVSVCLSGILLFSLMFSGVQAAEVAGEGTVEKPYLIGSAADFSFVREHPNACFRLLSDISLSAEDGDFFPIGTAETPFTGDFDGDGHGISGVRWDTAEVLYVGLFAANSGTVRDLTVSGEVSSGIAYGRYIKLYAGGIVGYNRGTVSGCVSRVAVSVKNACESGVVYAGGVCGYTQGGKIRNCKNESTVSATCSGEFSGGYIGGVCGGNQNGEVDDCENAGTVSALGEGQSGTVSCGGIAGMDMGTVERCRNTAPVQVTAEGRSTDAWAAGIAADHRGHTSLSSVQDCQNEGTVSASSKAGWACAGGVVCISAGEQAAITRCANSGEVTAVSQKWEETVRAGGVAAYGANISECANVGRVSAEGSVVFAGGIQGAGGVTLSDCFNMGTVAVTCPSESGTLYVGGITGENGYLDPTSQYPGSITNCCTVGAIRLSAGGSSYAAGGFVGSVVGKNEGGLLKHCYYPAAAELSGIGGTNLSAEGVQALPPEAVRTKAAYVGFDFETVWAWDDALAFPVLKNVPLSLSSAKENTVEFAGGNGSIPAPYRIRTKEQLCHVSEYLDACFLLENDIDLSATAFCPIGNEEAPFIGLFDGNGHTLSGLRVELDGKGESAPAGLFGCNAGTVRHLYVADCEIRAASFDGYAYAGGIAGINRGIVSGCCVSGTVSAVKEAGLDGYAYAGGIAGFNAGLVSRSYNTAAVTAEELAAVDETGEWGLLASAMAGGVAGGNRACISDCYNTGTVRSVAPGKDQAIAGGVAGLNDSPSTSKIEHCYSVGHLACTGNTACRLGGVVGYNNGAVECAGWLCPVKAASGYDSGYSSVKAFLLTEESASDPTAFSGFDFEEIWEFVETADYPCPQLRGVRFAAPTLVFEAEPTPGDTDGDTAVTTTDARLTLQYAAGKIPADALSVTAADVDGDGEITTTDARLILQYAAGKIHEWPCKAD